jgi:MFS family permease
MQGDLAIGEGGVPGRRLLAHPAWLALWSVVAAFGTYACMYGFRKPFTAGSFTGTDFPDGFKVWLVTSQVLGYTVSKFVGIRVIAEMAPGRRARMILGLVGASQASLLLFGLLPSPLNVACLFLNGLPLGMVFGLVLGFLEGRKLTEALVAGLCASFILADGMAKSVGAMLLEWGVAERWMPFVAGMVFLGPLVGFVWMLQRIPPPTPADVQARSPRVPMTREDRRGWLRRHGLGIALISFAYLLVTVLRSLRADFAPELWTALGTTGKPAVFTRSELWVALGVVLANGAVFLVRDNRRSFFLALGVSIGGLLLGGMALLGLRAGRLDAFPFMVLLGLGLYLPYVAVHTTVFERLIAMTGDPGNIGYLMYLADAFGYLGYVAVMILKLLAKPDHGFLDFFNTAAAIALTLAVAAFALAWGVFARPAKGASRRN